jgi:Raf kinase inhibitor-like YbhB/YbcL family protein
VFQQIEVLRAPLCLSRRWLLQATASCASVQLARALRPVSAEGATMAFRLTSSAFESNEPIPRRYTCEGDDLSPPLAWSGTPAGTRSFALVCEDPDAPSGTFCHWGICDIDPSLSSLPEGFPKQAAVGMARQVTNDFGRFGYGGACPPPGNGTHHYRFRLWALKVARLLVSQGGGCEAIVSAASAQSLAEAELVGTYAR